MAAAFTGFWEARGLNPLGLGPDPDDEVRTTLGPVALDDLLVRLRERLASMPAGALVRIDLIAWDNDAPPPDQGAIRASDA